MLQTIAAVALIMHGIGHVMGVFPVFNLWSIEGQSSRSWLLTDFIGKRASDLLSVALWLTAMVGFIAAGLGMLGWLIPATWWQPLAITSSIISIFTIVLYWSAFYTSFNKIAALAVDIVVLGVLLWPT
jgi:hypothetical protein